MLIILFHIHSFFFKKAKKFKCLYQNRSADLADGLFLELCFHVGGDTNFFDYAKLRVNQSNVNCKTHCSIATYAALCLLVITCSSKIYILNCLTSMKFLNHTQKKKIDNMAAVAQCILGAECVSSALYFLEQIRSTKTHF